MPEPRMIWLIVQHGGTSAEWYATTYDTEKDATDSIARAARDSYNCIGPYPITDSLLAACVSSGYAVEAAIIELVQRACSDAATDNFTNVPTTPDPE